MSHRKPDWLQNPVCARAEEMIVRCLHNQSKSNSSLPPIQVEKAIEWAQEKAGFAFADHRAVASQAGIAIKDIHSDWRAGHR